MNLEYYVEEKKYDKRITDNIAQEIYKRCKVEENYFTNISDNIVILENLVPWRKNLINWYKFKKDSNLLEIGAGCGELTGEFCKRCKSVTTVEFSKEIGKIIEERNSEANNLEVIIGDLRKIKFDKKFDYICLIGTLNYAALIYDSSQPYLDLLKFAKNLLSDEGTIIIATDNSLGSRYISGDKSEHVTEIYGTLLDNYTNTKLFNKVELDKLLQNLEFSNIKYYYPLPNYRIPNVIFSDNYFPNKSLTKLDYNVIYNDAAIITLDEIKFIKAMNNIGKFTEFANSYFIELSNSKNDNPNFISFNNMRNSKYCLKLELYDKKVVKSPIFEQGIEHINSMKNIIKELTKLGFFILERDGEEDVNSVESDFIKDKTLDQLIYAKIVKGSFEEAYELINSWYEYIKNKLTEESNILKIENNLIYIKNAFIDLVFENTFVVDNNFCFFDQEWKMENVPVEYILYRAIKNLYIYNSNLENIIPFSNILTNYSLTEYEDKFEQMEKDFQKKIINKDVCEFYKNQNLCKRYNFSNICKEKIEIEELKKILDIKEKNINSKIQILKEKDEQINTLEEELAKYRDSRIIRLIMKIKRERKNNEYIK